MALLVDTNVLLRSAQPAHPLYRSAVYALEALLKHDEALYIALQNVAEFWNVATRPTAQNGLGFTIEEAEVELRRFEGLFPLIVETADSYVIWKALVTQHRVSGVQVHDARLVATMKAHGLASIITFSVADFARYPGIAVLHPDQVV